MKKDIIRIVIAAALLAAAICMGGKISIILNIIAYLIAGYETLLTAGRNIIHGQVFDENFLMAVASLGAMALGEYEEAIGVMLFYQIGELFEDYAVNKSRKSIADLMNICPETARVLRNGVEETVDPYDVCVEETILIRPGERIPLDCIITEGSSSIDTSSLTGESIPLDVSAGNEIASGCINLNGVLQAKVLKPYEESTVSKILELVENAASKKAPVENFITKFARIYTPVVVFCAILLAIVPPLACQQDFSIWIYRACLFLIVSCPCALVISVPMSFFGGIGAASSKGILVKGGNYLQVLAGLDTILFDKTGTLTRGSFVIDEVESSRADFLKLAASIEKESNHPIAKCIQDAYDGERYRMTTFREIPGMGIEAEMDGIRYYAGNARLMKTLSIEKEDQGTVIYFAEENAFLGFIKVKDELKEDTRLALEELKGYVSRMVMLTGDQESAAEMIGQEAGIGEVHAGLLPGDKVAIAEEIIESSNGRCAFVGDGMNDAPVLARADVGIAMGGLGSAAALEASDVVIMDDNLRKIPLGIRIGKKTLRICRENIVFALGVKMIVLVLGALGMATMWAAVFADVGVAILAILNAMRTLHMQD